MSTPCVHSHVNHVKSEIHAVFTRHMNSLASRRQWLLDQVDSIKEGMIRRQSFLEGKLEAYIEFMKFSVDQEYEEGVNFASNGSEFLQERNLKAIISQDLPYVEFVHNDAMMQNNIVNYGRLETGNASTSHSVDSENLSKNQSSDSICKQAISREGEGQCCCDFRRSMQNRFQMEAMESPRILANTSSQKARSHCEANKRSESMSKSSYEIQDKYDAVTILQKNLHAIFESDQEQDGIERCPSFEQGFIVDLETKLEDIFSTNELMPASSRAVALTPLADDNADSIISDIHARMEQIINSPCVMDQQCRSDEPVSEIPSLQQSNDSMLCSEKEGEAKNERSEKVDSDELVQCTDRACMPNVHAEENDMAKCENMQVSSQDIVDLLAAKLQRIIYDF